MNDSHDKSDVWRIIRLISFAASVVIAIAAKASGIIDWGELGIGLMGLFGLVTIVGVLQAILAEIKRPDKDDGQESLRPFRRALAAVGPPVVYVCGSLLAATSIVLVGLGLWYVSASTEKAVRAGSEEAPMLGKEALTTKLGNYYLLHRVWLANHLVTNEDAQNRVVERLQKLRTAGADETPTVARSIANELRLMLCPTELFPEPFGLCQYAGPGKNGLAQFLARQEDVLIDIPVGVPDGHAVEPLPADAWMTYVMVLRLAPRDTKKLKSIPNMAEMAHRPLSLATLAGLASLRKGIFVQHGRLTEKWGDWVAESYEKWRSDPSMSEQQVNQLFVDKVRAFVLDETKKWGAGELVQ